MDNFSIRTFCSSFIVLVTQISIYASAPASWPAWVPVLTSFGDEQQCGSVGWINPFLSNLLLGHGVCARIETLTKTEHFQGMQELMQRPWRDVTYWLASPGLLSLLSYRTQDHQPRDGTTHNGLGPPTLITSWENALQLDLKETFPQGRLLSLW